MRDLAGSESPCDLARTYEVGVTLTSATCPFCPGSCWNPLTVNPTSVRGRDARVQSLGPEVLTSPNHTDDVGRVHDISEWIGAEEHEVRR